MIGMSRSQPCEALRGASPTGWDPVLVRIAGIWHACCLSLVGGCLYIEPAWTPNQPPEIIVPELAAGEEYLLDLNTTQVATVVGKDEDSNEIKCFWDVPNVAVPNSNCDGPTDALISTTLILDRDPAFLATLDGQLILAHLIDVAADDADVVVRFRAAFVGGGF